MTDFRASANEPPIDSVDQLVEQMHRAGRHRARWMIGTEYEKVVVDRATGRAAPFSGPRGIEAVLRELAERYGWQRGGRAHGGARARERVHHARARGTARALR
jgi:gamma-glutamylcysteine synthetase